MKYRLPKRVLISLMGVLAAVGWQMVGTAMAQGPSFDCGNASGSIEEMICNDGELSALDRKLAGVYAAASKKAANEHPPVLKAEQRGWLKGRNECWKSEDSRACTEKAYQLRIAELQARYRLVPETGPFWYACDGNPANEVVVTFFRTDPPTLIAERGDSVSLMYLEPSGSGSFYRGRNESFWEHRGEATVVWGYGSPQMRCVKKRSAFQSGSSAGATDPAIPLTALPVESREAVAPVAYKSASELAAGGGDPLDIALEIAGSFEGSSQHIVQANEGGEAPSGFRITIVRDGLRDDSVRGSRWDILLEKAEANLWRIEEVMRSWRCWRGDKTDRFATDLCP